MSVKMLVNVCNSFHVQITKAQGGTPQEPLVMKKKMMIKIYMIIMVIMLKEMKMMG
jgi:hypothetical protein